MSAWPGKYVIGLTGNIATGKSVVRKMLENLGAYGIDADALAHRAIAQGAPGYLPVVDTFGRWILSRDGQIDRSKLGRIVFSDPEALARLEAILHPLVGGAIDLLVRRSRHTVIVVEAIKLLESGLGERCDAIWVAVAPFEVQLARLTGKRGLSEAAANQRIAIQRPQAELIAAAHVVIYNERSFTRTWRQVLAAWQKTVPGKVELPATSVESIRGKMVVRRATPRQADEIAAFVTCLPQGRREVSTDDIMAAFGEKAYLLLKIDERLVGLVGWKVENLVARVDEIFLEPSIPYREAIRTLVEKIEADSGELQCEAALVFLPPDLSERDDIWHELGYQPRSIHSLDVRAWQEAASESMPVGSTLLFKQLREERVLRPV